MFHIIDDDDVVRDLHSDLVLAVGYQALSFASGDEYLAYFDSEQYLKPTAILSDVTMPGMDGHAMSLYIRKKLPMQKIVLISGDCDDSHHLFVARNQCYFLDKPFHFKALQSLLLALSACELAHQHMQNKAGFPHCKAEIGQQCPFAHTIES